MVRLRLVVVAALALVGCKSAVTPTGFGINLTVTADALSATDRARIAQLIVSVRGVETNSQAFSVASFIKSSAVHGRYIPAAHAGTLDFWIDAVDASGAVVANGNSGDVPIIDGKASSATIGLAAFSAAVALGGACGISRECDGGGSCVDGICCDSDCSDACVACNLPGSVGRCAPIPAGQPPAHGACAPASCDLTTNRFTPAQVCDGNGSCETLAGYDCSPYKCMDSTSCFPSCSDSTQCASGNSCTAGSCGLLSNGRMCTDASQCNSGYCVDGVCCDGSCAGQCQACDIPDVAGALGTCTIVASGAPHSSHPSCAGNGTLCAGSCNGGSAMECAYPTSSCGASTCSGTMETDMLCNMGACGAVAKSCASGFACGTNSCATSCDVVTNSGCDTNFVCASGSGCLRKVSFANAVTLSVGQNPIAIASGLFDSDSFADVVTADATSSSMDLYHGNGDGTFALISPPDAGVTTPTAVAAADLDGDGHTDVAFANSDNTLTVMQNSNGIPDTFTWSHPASGTTPRSVALANFDANPKLDIAVANGVGAGTVTVLLNTGTSFTLKSTPGVGNSPVAVAAADLNKDGANDLVVVNNGSNNVSVLLGNGDGTFALKSSPNVGNHPTSLGIGDLTGDGVPDLVVTNNDEVTLTVLQGAGDGTFTLKSNPSVNAGASSVALADFNRDGRLDVAVVNSTSTLYLLLGNGDGTFPYQTTLTVPTGARYVIAVDLNNDLRPDLVTANGSNNSISSLLNTSP